MKIGELANQTGTSVEALRFYERFGLLPKPARTASGYRVYASVDLRRVELIHQAKRLGFSLEEIKRVLRLRQRGSCPCGEVVQMLEKHIRETDDQIRNLQRFRRELTRTLVDWKKSGDATISGDVICGLIERTIPSAATAHSPRNRKLRQPA